MLVVLLWAAAAYMTLGILMCIANIGKPREPITAGQAVGILVFSGAIVGVLVTAAVALS